MENPQYEQSTKESQVLKNRKKRLSWMHIVISLLAVLLIGLGVVLNIKGMAQGSTILTALGIIIGLVQWLFPISVHEQNSSSHNPSSYPATQIIIQVPPNQSISSDLILTNKSALGNTQHTTPISIQEDELVPTTNSPTIEEPLVIRPNSIFLFNVNLPTPSEFYGRPRERETLVSRTYNKASTSIIGPRRIGKTWLIEYLNLVAKTKLGSCFHIGYLDATIPGCETIAGFTQKALKGLGIPSSNSTNLDLKILSNAVEDLKSKYQIPVLCIDEFEGFGNQQAFDLNFFIGLRALTQIGLVLVTASRSMLIDIVGDYGKTSGFFNVFEQLSLEPFSPNEAEAFANTKSRQAGFTEKEQAYLLKYGQIDEKQWSPMRLQLVGKMLLDDKILSIKENLNYYRPTDPDYWQKFEEQLEVKYRGVVR